MTVSSKDIEAMRKLRAIMSGSPSPGAPTQRTSKPQSNNAASTGRPDVDAMASILKRFHAASEGTAERLVEDSQFDPRVREYLDTEKTPSGVRIGKFEVAAKITELSGKKQKVYDVIESGNIELGNIEPVFSSLTLSEAAHAIVRYLNKGLKTTDSRIQNVVDLEETYTRNRMDALRFKHRYQRCVELNESKAGNVFADRYQVARANALVAMDQIKTILDTIR